MADIIFEEIAPYVEGEGDTGKTSREKIKRNFEKAKQMLAEFYEVLQRVPVISNIEGDHFSICDNKGFAVVIFRDGHIETKEFDSRKVISTDQIDLATGDADFSLADENDNIIVEFKDGHIRTQNFDSREMVGGVSIGNMISNAIQEFGQSDKIAIIKQFADADFAIMDEQGFIIALFKDGHIKTKCFDSENITAADGYDVEYPQFMGYGIDDSTGEDVTSLVHLTSTWVRASKGDTVQVLDATKIGGFKVYEYKSVNGQLLAKSDSFATEKYTVQNNNTAFIRILVVLDGTTTLYSNKNARCNVYVTHVNPILPQDDKLQLNSTIPDGWYVATRSEFPAAHVKKGGYWNQWGAQVPDDIVPLEGNNIVDGETISGIYDHYDELYQKYGPEGSDIIGKGYISREILGRDESGTYDIYRYVFEPKVMDVVGQGTGDFGKSRGVNNESLPKICLEACLHGSERPCSRALLNFLIHLCDGWRDDKFLEWIRWNVKLVVIPIANPWGYVNHSRCNTNHVDLNRNFNGNGGWALFPDKGSSASDYKGTAPYSEAETRLIARNMLENADAIAYFDLHTHGSYGGFKVMTRFDYGNDEFLGNMLSAVGQELTKGFTISGILNHEMDDQAIYETKANGTFEYFGQVGCSSGSVPYIANQGVENGLPAASPEVTYLRQYFDKAQHYSSAAYDDTCYTLPTDCMNEEYVANLVLCTLRQRFIQSKKQ